MAKVNAAVSQLAGERTPGIFEATEFTLADGRPFETVEEVIATTTLSASHGGTRLFGVTIKDDTNNPPKVICYTGNGPASEGNARFIAEAVNLSAALSEREEKLPKLVEAVKESICSVPCGSKSCNKLRAALSALGESK